MSNFLKKIKKFVLGEKDAQEIAGSLHDFNKIAESYIGILKEDIRKKEEKLNKIRVLVQGGLPKDFLQKQRGQVNITVLSKKDIGKSKKKDSVQSSPSKWEGIESTYNKKIGKSSGFKGGVI